MLRKGKVNPLVEKYPGWSPYNYCLNNPIITIDPDGRDTLYFDAQGNYLADQTKKSEGDHIGYYSDKDGNLVAFRFDDRSDVKSIESSVTDKWIENKDHFKLSGINIGENKVGEYFLGINSYFGSKYGVGYVHDQSQQNGMMDYVHQITNVDKSINSRVTVVDGMGYNNFDLGNYYWGRTMGRLGYTLEEALLAAQMFEICYRHKVDDPADQRAIANGVIKK